MQVAYPIFSNASPVPSCHDADMAGALRNPADAFDLERVRSRMKELGITQTSLAKELGLNQSAVSNLLRGNRQVKVHEAAAIEKFLGLVPTPLVAFVPVIGISSAGNWREAVEMPRRTIPVPPGLAGPRAFAVEYDGDSMDQVLHEGASVVVDPDQTQLYNGKVYMIANAEHETQIKVYQSNPARFEPRSSNDTHQVIYMGEEPIRVIGRVVYQGMAV